MGDEPTDIPSSSVKPRSRGETVRVRTIPYICALLHHEACEYIGKRLYVSTRFVVHRGCKCFASSATCGRNTFALSMHHEACRHIEKEMVHVLLVAFLLSFSAPHLCIASMFARTDTRGIFFQVTYDLRASPVQGQEIHGIKVGLVDTQDML